MWKFIQSIIFDFFINIGFLQELKDAVDARKEHLSESEKAHQFLYDCNEAEAWMSEQELYMMQVG